MRRIFYSIVIITFLLACNRNGEEFDASGSFEAEEVIVSSEAAGRIESLELDEGTNLQKNTIVGIIDAEIIQLQKEQVEASIASLKEKTVDVNPQIKMLQGQIAVQKTQLDNLLHERNRVENLIKADAATGKQLDDINAQIDVVRRQLVVTRRQIDVQRTNSSTQNRSVLSEQEPLEKRVKQLDQQIHDANIINPVNGTVIAQYAEAGEMTNVGKALYKIADISTMTLRAYITGDQFSQVKLGQQVKVFVDKGEDEYRTYPGTITWISDKAEFTPKTIQTKEERANLVFAIKVKVKNDGFLKIGMYGDVRFQ
jgi:HlyD family secretion protein